MDAGKLHYIIAVDSFENRPAEQQQQHHHQQQLTASTSIANDSSS
jgi:hypothetical protein